MPNNKKPLIILHNNEDRKWYRFTSPVQIISTSDINEVTDKLRLLEEIISSGKLYAVGFVSYEASQAFDSALKTKQPGTLPLFWFGIFQEPEILDELPRPFLNTDIPQDLQPEISHDNYINAIARIKEYILSGDTYQVNFTYRLKSSAAIDAYDIFLNLASGDSTPYAAFIDTGDFQICSLSPELFFTLDGSVITSRPMKGTSKRGLSFADDISKANALAASEKDKAENLMIVDMVRNDIGHIAKNGSVSVPQLFTIEKYPTVFQMTSTVTAETSANISQIFTALFPPASITGAPKKRTMEIITELENSPRNIYTGTIGMICPGRKAQFNVAIRTLLVNMADNSCEYGIGGGIVWDSTPQKEWEESILKSKVLFSAMPEFDLFETILWKPGEGFTLLKYHLSRLAQSAEYFNFKFDPAAINAKLEQLIPRINTQHHRIKLILKKNGAIKFEFTKVDPELLIFRDIRLASVPVDSSDIFLYHKTTNRRIYQEILSKSPGASDVLLFNELNEITETTIANITIESDGKLYTPPVSCGLLPGTLRQQLIDEGKLFERIIRRSEIANYPEIYLLNSVRGIHKVKLVCQ